MQLLFYTHKENMQHRLNHKYQGLYRNFLKHNKHHPVFRMHLWQDEYLSLYKHIMMPFSTYPTPHKSVFVNVIQSQPVNTLYIMFHNRSPLLSYLHKPLLSDNILVPPVPRRDHDIHIREDNKPSSYHLVSRDGNNKQQPPSWYCRYGNIHSICSWPWRAAVRNAYDGIWTYRKHEETCCRAYEALKEQNPCLFP